MARNAEKNALVREERRKQILDAALTTYIRYGFHGTDMDAVAQEAQLAKGLLYYYYKTKKELFTELFTWMFNESNSLSTRLLEDCKELNPVEQLVYYCYHIFASNQLNPRILQFNIRVPFDAYAVFGPDEWQDGVQISNQHRASLANIIEKGISQKMIPSTNPDLAANSFWSVFVANVFEYAKLMAGTKQPIENNIDTLRNVVQFAFQGLGIEYTLWNSYLEKIVVEHEKRG